MADSTASLAKPIDANGSLYQRRALEALPILVRQAIAGQAIFYSEIAAELEIPNARNMNFVLGAVGTSMLQLGAAWGETVPPIQALVVNKATGLPGKGFSEFAPDPSSFRNAPPGVKRRMVQVMLAHVFSYPRWDAVLTHFGIRPPPPPDLAFLLPVDTRRSLGGDGESAAHRALKERIAAEPALVGLAASGFTAQIEYAFPSGDAVDILFHGNDQHVAVEVKSRVSGASDLLRGIFQSVKYRALLDAEASVERRSADGRVLLAIEGSLPAELARIARTLGITVQERVGASE
jgi:hypothetical protein